MEATKMMRKMMVVASLMAMTACGSVQPVESEGDGVVDEGAGSDDAGSGSGDVDAGMPSGCMKAADCGDGMACDVATNECVVGMLTLEPMSEFIIDQHFWWTPTSDPFLRGTFDGPTAAVVQVKLGSAVGTMATLQGNTWSIKLAPGSIATTGTDVTIMMTDPSGGLVEITQKMFHDAAGPVISVVGKVKDERGDQIDFSTGEPVHTHVGTEVDLGASGCPVVYKYAYLMDETVPFGRGTTKNPLAWKFSIADTKLDPSTHQFRVRTDAGATLIDWRALPAPDASGTYTVELTRKGGAFPIALLGTRTGKFFIDVRARDWNQLEAVKSFCWDHHPIAAPVEVQPFQRDELFDISLPDDDASAHVINYEREFGIVHQRLVQHTAEAMTIDWSATFGPINYTRTTFYNWVADVQPSGSTMCPAGNTKPECRVNWAPSVTGGLDTRSGQILPSLSVVVIDEASKMVVAASSTTSTSITIPARAVGAPPRAYRVIVNSASFSELQPPTYFGSEQFGDFALMGLSYLGWAPMAAGVSCANMQQTAWGPMCSQINYYWRFGALDHARIDFTSITASIKSAGVALSHVGPELSAGVMSWDAGDDDLPGAY